MSGAATTISCGAVLLIAILNPLLCLLHCSFTQHRHGLTAEQQMFLCDPGEHTPALTSTPFSAVWNSPRAVYQALPVAIPALVVIIVLMTRLRASTSARRTHIPLPEFPPPKACSSSVQAPLTA